VAPTIGEDQQLDDFCDFLSAEWKGTRPHSYLVPNRGKSSVWSQSLPGGVWSAVGLKGCPMPIQLEWKNTFGQQK
jgi:hypothetical protein